MVTDGNPFFNNCNINNNSGTFFIFDKPQSSITKGQFVVWYNGDELIGSGVID